ncbi:MAG: UDP-N-acetylmuramate--L-alanine ligase [Phycisphaerales bacterium]|nr:UDP-N-acetylmuramate--L-alanine ligase [Phycisphaerales bacterium]
MGMDAPLPLKSRPVRVAPPMLDRSGEPAENAGVRLIGRDVFMIGIGGCGMSGLARLASRLGAKVGGCDGQFSPVTEALGKDGIGVVPEADAKSLPEACDLVIASAAVRETHPLVTEAKARDIPVLRYAEALGELMRRSTGVAIAGTHGKSTTTAMLGATLVDLGLDPSVIVGASCSQLAGGSIGSPVFASPSGHRVGAQLVPAGSYSGRPGLLLAEACEFNRSFHNLAPTIASIASVEEDHLDIYGSIDEIITAFNAFARLLPPADEGGYLLIAHQGAHREKVTAGVKAKVETIGFAPGADWTVDFDASEQMVSLSRKGELLARWKSRMPGDHNAMNAATALALAIHLGGDAETGARSLAQFRGIDRRCQWLGDRRVSGGGAVRVYDDYGHHPTEIDATLRALRGSEKPQERGGRLICVFQPHQHSRTRFLLDEFASAFSQADIVIVPHIYFVRDTEAEKHLVTAGDLVDRLRDRGVRAMHLYPFGAIVEQLENLCRENDLLVVMGAGPVWQVARDYLATGPAPVHAPGSKA